MAAKVRLDRLLVERGHAGSLEQARGLIASGRVRVDGIPAQNTATQVDCARPVTVVSGEHEWVGRGARKLLSVIDGLGVDPTGLICADLGASTGGFTEVLLHRGARRVHAVDVGRGLLHGRLRDDARVVLHEGVNARYLQSLGEPIGLVVGDLSFISLALILPAVGRILQPGGEALLLVKPQFEASREGVGRGGRVHCSEIRQQAIRRVCDAASSAGFRIIGGMDSGVHGAKAGNVEHFLHMAVECSARHS